jgi:hypothetical protein
MNALKIRLTNLSLVAAAVAAFGLGAMNTTSASAVPTDEPWPEPPSCSNETGTCTSIADQLAYECYFTEDDWCETELPDILEFEVEPSRDGTLTAGNPTPPPPARTLVAR